MYVDTSPKPTKLAKSMPENIAQEEIFGISFIKPSQLKDTSATNQQVDAMDISM